MALAGLAYGSIQASSFCRAQNKVRTFGYANDTNTFVMISGIHMRFLYKYFGFFLNLQFNCTSNYCFRFVVIWVFIGKFHWAYHCWGYGSSQRVSFHHHGFLHFVFDDVADRCV